MFITRKSLTKSTLLLALWRLVKVTERLYDDIVGGGGSVAEWLACWTQGQKGPGSNHSREAVG